MIIGNILSNRLIGGAGNDVIYADGFDAVIHDGGSSGIYDRMVSGGLGATESAPSTIMTYVGDPTAQHDEIIGGSGEDYIHGGRGSDTLVGGSENDVLIGGTGNDVIYGGEENVTGFNRADGVDIADYSEELSGITVNFNATVSTQSLSVIDGQSGNDTLNSIEKVIATTGQDTFNFQGTLPNGLKFEIDGNGGHDIINLGGSSMTGGASLVLSGNGRITNKAGGSGEIILKNYKTEIFGSDYDDSITDRGDGTHIINAGEGDDTITVGGHNGIINGESGNDVIHLGSSSATVQFAVGGGSDVVEFDNDDGDYHLQLLNLNPDDIALIAGGRDIYFSTGTIEEYDGRYEKIYYQFLTVQIKSTGEQITFLENGRNIGPDGNGGAITYNGPGSAKDQGKLDSITFADGTVITQGQIWHYLDHPGDAPISVWYDTWGYRSDFTDDNANDYLEHVNQTYLQAAPIGAPPPPPDDEFDGTPGDDNIKPGYGNDTVEGGQGDDTINESVGDDTYKWAVGDGNDVIVGDGTLSGSNRLELGAGVTASDLQFAVVNNGLGLAISFANVSGSITLDEQLIGQGFGVDQIVFADTTVMTRAQILAAASSEISAATTYQTGTSGNNSMSAYFGNFVIDGGGGNDTITAWTNGSGIYRFANNQGNDKLAHGSGIVRNDTLELTGANSGDISLSRSSDNLVVTITSTGATFTVNDQFAYDGVSVYGINTLKFANGTTWDREYIAGLASGNTAPVADAAVASTIQDAALLHGTLTATDPDVNGWLTFALDDRVDGLVLNRDGSWTFDPSDPAYRSLAADTPLTVTANYHVTDQEGLTSSSTLSITITGTDDLPTLLHTLSNQRVADSASFSYDLSGKFADADGDALTLSAALADGSPLPGWLSFDGEVVSGTAPNGQSGVLDIQITASDGEYSATGAFLLHFGADNDAPVVDHPLPSVDGAVGILVDVLVPLNTFSDAEGDSIMVSATLASGASLPSWLTFSDGRLTGTPPVGSADEYAIKITASDGEASTSSVFTLDIAPYQTILGTADNDYIVLPENAFLVDAGLGNDTLLVSGEGAGIFSFSSGDGHDFIMQSMWGTRDDTLRFTDLLPSDVTLARSADSLTITVTATGDTVGIASQFFEWDDRGVSYVEFADNTVWTRPDLLAFTVI